MGLGISGRRRRLGARLLSFLFIGSCLLGYLPLALTQEPPQALLRSIEEPGPRGLTAVSGDARSARAAVGTLTINPIYDDAAMAAAGLSPGQIANVKTAFAAAAAQLTSNFHDPINVNITVTAVPGTTVLGQSLFFSSVFSYSSVRTSLLADSKTADDATALGGSGSVAASDPVVSTHNWRVGSALAKALGLIPDDLITDGTFSFGAGFTYAFDPNNVGVGQYDFQGVAMHEITEIMGRVPGLGTVLGGTPNYKPFDLFRYTGPGTRGLTGGGGIQFSLDGGTTLLKPFNNAVSNGGDAGDWASGTNDSFNAFSSSGVKNGLSEVDFRVMDVIGYDRSTTPACTYSLGPGSGTNVPAVGGSGSITVTTSAGCFWSASSDSGFLQITSGFSGAGPGTVQFSALLNSGAQRVGHITIAGQTYTVTQASGVGCSYTLGPGSGTNIPAAGGSGSITVTTSAGCFWSASSDSAFLQITSGSSGTGPGAVQFSVPQNSGAARVGIITIAAQTYTVTQAGGSCSYTLGPGSGTSVPAAGASGSITVTTAPGCFWSADSDSGFLQITGGFSGAGPGTVQFTALPSLGAPRVGHITVADQTYTVTQAGVGSCTYTLGPGSGTNVPAVGGSGSITVTTSPGCAWSAASDSAWLVITNGFSGSGSGSVQFSTLLNSGAQRVGIITIAGQTYTVTQAGASGPGNTPDNALTLSQFVGGGPEWNTTLYVTNLSNTAESYTIRFFDDAGLAKAMPIDTLGMVNSIAGMLNPGQTRRYQTGAAPTLQAAWALLTPATPGTARLAGFAIFRQTVPSGASTVSSEGVVDLLGVTDSKYVLLYDNLGGPVTTAAFANPDALNSLTILADIRDEAGTVLATDSIVLPPLGHTAFRLMDRFPVTINQRGSILLNAFPKGFTGLGLNFSIFGTFTSFRLQTSRDIQ